MNALLACALPIYAALLFGQIVALLLIFEPTSEATP